VVYDAVRDSAIEFFILFALWLLFVGQTSANELLAGAGAAFLGAVADALLKAESFAKFKPKFKWLLLITWEVWYVLSGTGAIMLALLKRIIGKESEAQFKAVRFEAGGDDPESWARLALVTMLVTISPNSIVVGIDTECGLMLSHLLPAGGTPEIAKRLGAGE
jgi:multisubunit Na+/H+ antiporter MnhE subunit